MEMFQGETGDHMKLTPKFVKAVQEELKRAAVATLRAI